MFSSETESASASLPLNAVLALTLLVSVSWSLLSRPSRIRLETKEQPHLGQPVRLRSYRRHVSLAFATLLLLALSIFSFDLLQVAFAAADQEQHWRTPAAAHSIDAALWLQVIILVHRRAARPHFSTIVHIGVVTFVSALLRAVQALTPPPDRSSYVWRPSSLLCLLSTAAFVVVATIPSGPARTADDPSSPGQRIEIADADGRASLLGHLFFPYVLPVVKRVRSKGHLDPSDVPLLNADSSASQHALRMTSALEGHYSKSTSAFTSTHVSVAPFLWSLFTANRKQVMAVVWISAPVAASWYIPAFYLNRIVVFLSENPDASSSFRLAHGLKYALGLGFFMCLAGLLQNAMFVIMGPKLYLGIRTQVQAALFQKALRKKAARATSSTSEGLDSDNSSSHSEAQILQLATDDANRVATIGQHASTFLVAPVEIAVGGYLLINLLGWSALIGLALSFVLNPVILLCSALQARIEGRLQKTKDKRTTLLKETLAAIRMIKFSASERKAASRIMQVRYKNLRLQRLNFAVQAANGALFNFSPIFASIIAIGVYTLFFEQTLTPARAFTSVAILNELRYSLTTMPDALSAIIQVLVSARRIAAFLTAGEVPPHLQLDPDARGTPVVAFEDAKVTWPGGAVSGASTPSSFVLEANVRFEPLAITLVCGPIGSGKSLLLQSLLGETTTLSGRIRCPRSAPTTLGSPKPIAESEWLLNDAVAYVPQETFLANGTVRELILFGLPLEERRYQATLKACQLLTDIALWNDGDQTDVLENGSGLSGGQKARVSLARAIYSRARTLLLEDILSALDTHTGAAIVKDLLRGPLCSDRTIVLVSHHTRLVAPVAARVVMLSAGKIEYNGDAATFMQSSSLFHQGDVASGDVAGEKKDEDETTGNDEATAPAEPFTSPSPTAEEKREKGHVRLHVYKTYLRCAGYFLSLVAFISIIIFTFWPLLTNAWLQKWTEDAGNPDPRFSTKYYFVRWAGLCAIEVVLAFAASLLVYVVSLRASGRLFEMMLTRVLGATIRYHDMTSHGRIFNRFADISPLDSNMAPLFSETSREILLAVSSLVGISFYTGRGFWLLIAVLLPMYLAVARAYTATTRDLRRLGAVTQSPMMAALSEVLDGVAVLRAFGAQDWATAKFIALLDANLRYFWWLNICSRWMSVTFNSLNSVVIVVATTLVLAQKDVNAAQVGFVLGFLITLQAHSTFALSYYGQLDQQLVAVERVVDLATAVPQEEEAPASDIVAAPPAWPRGALSIENLRVRYAPELDDVLHDVTFSCLPGTKVAVVGATGSGKSTLAAALFRFVNASSGRIVLDDIDISKVALSDLRSRIQIVPQEPVILSGTMRSAVDVFDEYSDDEVRTALKAVRLARGSIASDSNDDNQSNIFDDLTHTIAEGGSNLSRGQRQLMCLARALLRRCKVIVLDEASSSVDHETDEALSASLKDAFQDSTVITIAHRLRTIIEYDVVLVMEAGNIIEKGTPIDLIEDSQSSFARLCKATGTEYEDLLALARARARAASD